MATVELQTLAIAQAWKVIEELPGVDLAGLTGPKRAEALDVLRQVECPCGCSMKLAQCRVEDQSCSVSPEVARSLVEGIRSRLPDGQAVPASSPTTKREDGPPGAPSLGRPDAPVTIIAYFDYRCPFSRSAMSWIDSLVREGSIRVLLKHYPISGSEARLAAEAAVAANAQGRFWDLHPLIFRNADKISKGSLLRAAANLGLDMDRFVADLDAGRCADAVNRDVAEGQASGAKGTPAFVIDGMLHEGPSTREGLESAIGRALRRKARP